MLAVVSDSSPLIYLTRLQVFHVLRDLHDQIFVPKGVWEEIVTGGSGLPEASNLEQAVREGWVHVRVSGLQPSLLGSTAERLGRGELEAILLAKELKAILLTDDSDARHAAERIGIRVSGTLGTLVRAKRKGHVPEVKPLLERLRTETNFRISEQLYQRALAESGES
jgi:uncharacterized protein